MRKNFWYDLFYLLAGIVFGGVISHFTAGVKGLSWLAYGLNFGTTKPFALELGILNLTFGVSISLTVATILCITVCFILGKFIFKK